MKTRYLVSMLTGFALTFSSCMDDLDVMPLDETVVTSEVAYSDPDSYLKSLFKIYSAWSMSGQDGEESTDVVGLDAGNAQLLRSYWILQEVAADHALVSKTWGDTWVEEINTLTWSNVQNEPIEAVYQRAMFLVALVNDYLKVVDNAPVELNPEQLKSEARFNRALAYWVLMDLYGAPPFITESTYSINPAPLDKIEQTGDKPVNLFNWIESELRDLIDALPAPGQGIYGRADQGAVYALLAKLYLNAEVYTGEARYTDCIAASKEVIAGGYGLATNYHELFYADNGQNSDTRQEIIFPVLFDGAATKSYGGMTFFISASRSGSDVDLERDGISEGWDGIHTTQNLVSVFDFDGEQSAANILDKRGIFHSDGIDVNISSNEFYNDGWSVFKYKNIYSTGGYPSETKFPETDFPLFRLADVYLMYAEAVARGGQGGDMATAVAYVNELRERAFGNTNHAIDAAWLAANDFQNILDERARELYWEAGRRTDLIRFGQYTSGYNWPLKNGITEGADLNSRYVLYPIPVTDLSVNGNLSQNPGYGN